MMKKIAVFICCALLAATGRAQALTLSLEGPGTVVVGSNFAVDIVFSGLGDLGVKGFMIDVLYDDNKMEIANYTPGGSLGALSDDVFTVSSGRIHLFEVSSLLEQALLDLQDDLLSLTLVTLNFNCLAPEPSEISIGVAPMVGLAGGSLYDFPTPASLLVNQSSAVPEPSTLLLLGGGLLGLCATRRKDLKRRS